MPIGILRKRLTRLMISGAGVSLFALVATAAVVGVSGDAATSNQQSTVSVVSGPASISASASAVASTSAGTPGVASSRTIPARLQCQSYVLPLRLTESSTDKQSVSGQLCYRGTVTAATPVQVLIHGGAYNSSYWDSPFQPERYSYVQVATARGYATFNYDRIGYGQSSHPDPSKLNFDVAGFTAHQIVQLLRQGTLGFRFNTVILNGHSMGAETAEKEAAAYNDVDGLIVSGIGHNFEVTPEKLATFVPAQTDPRFLPRPELIGYLTSRPNGRIAEFVEGGTYDPAIPAFEENVFKDTLSPFELIALNNDSSDTSDVTRRIRVPVLYVQGRYDKIWCSRTGDCLTDAQSIKEASYWSPAISFTRVVIPNAGHSINSNLSAPTFYEATFTWLGQHGLAPR